MHDDRPYRTAPDCCNFFCGMSGSGGSHGLSVLAIRRVLVGHAVHPLGRKARPDRSSAFRMPAPLRWTDSVTVDLTRARSSMLSMPFRPMWSFCTFRTAPTPPQSKPRPSRSMAEPGAVPKPPGAPKQQPGPAAPAVPASAGWRTLQPVRGPVFPCPRVKFDPHESSSVGQNQDSSFVSSCRERLPATGLKARAAPVWQGSPLPGSRFLIGAGEDDEPHRPLIFSK